MLAKVHITIIKREEFSEFFFFFIPWKYCLSDAARLWLQSEHDKMNVFARSRARYRGIYLIHTANHVNFITRLFEKKPVLPKIYSFSYFKRRSAAVAAGPGEIFISKQIFISLVTHIYIAVRVYIFNKNRFFIFHEIDQQKDDEAGRNYSIIGSETRNIRAPPSLSLYKYIMFINQAQVVCYYFYTF